MSKLLGPKLTLESSFSHSRGVGVEGMKRQYICRKCSCTFPHYKGVKQVAPGIAYCPEHNPSALTPKT